MPPAQQAAKWRPSIAEDNKTATWEETASFLRDILSADGNARIDWKGGLGEIFVSSALTEARCTLQVTHGFRAGSNELTVKALRIDLSKVDPLSIQVSSGLTMANAPFAITLSGTNDAKFTVGTETTYACENKSYYRAHFNVLADATSPCVKEREKHDDADYRGSSHVRFGECTTKAVNAYSISLPFVDMEISKRFSRAMLHAALLGGGTKAVSPF